MVSIFQARKVDTQKLSTTREVVEAIQNTFLGGSNSTLSLGQELRLMVEQQKVVYSPPDVRELEGVYQGVKESLNLYFAYVLYILGWEEKIEYFLRRYEVLHQFGWGNSTTREDFAREVERLLRFRASLCSHGIKFPEDGRYKDFFLLASERGDRNMQVRLLKLLNRISFREATARALVNRSEYIGIESVYQVLSHRLRYSFDDSCLPDQSGLKWGEKTRVNWERALDGHQIVIYVEDHKMILRGSGASVRLKLPGDASHYENNAPLVQFIPQSWQVPEDLIQ